jgi:hypothetical protein
VTILRVSILAAIAAGGMITACAAAPATATSTSIPLFPQASGAPIVASAPSAQASGQASTGDRASCAVYLADVRDVRVDPNDLGMMGMRAIKTPDSDAWLQAALATLKKDPRLRFVDAGKDADLVLRIELVKAYVMTITTQKTSNVVLRVGYSRDDKELDTQIARGRDTGANWVNGDDEAQGSLNRALSAAVWELGNDIVNRCDAVRTGR